MVETMVSAKGNDLEIVLEPEGGVRVLSGKMPGRLARAKYLLDEIDASDRRVVVRVKVPVLTSSFILGMFSQSVRKLGVEKFREKYYFEANKGIMDNIDVNIRFSADDRTALVPSTVISKRR